MGGTPHTALAIIGFPSCDYKPELLSIVLNGALSILDSVDVRLIGGHTFEDSELKFGLSVTGTVNKTDILRNNGALAGDILVLTKPLGSGILTTALKGGRIGVDELKEAVSWMTTLNNQSARTALRAGIHACTDVTGFGLLGHAFNMVRNTGTDFVIDLKEVPFMDRVHEMADKGMIPEGAYRNLNFLRGHLLMENDIPEDDLLLVCDPQTSGGLLLAMEEPGLQEFTAKGIFTKVIGRVVEGKGRLLLR